MAALVGDAAWTTALIYTESVIFATFAVALSLLCSIATTLRCRRTWTAFHGFALVESFLALTGDLVSLSLLLLTRSVCSAEDVLVTVIVDVISLVHTCLVVLRLGVFRHVSQVAEPFRRALLVGTPLVFIVIEATTLSDACNAVWAMPASSTTTSMTSVVKSAVGFDLTDLPGLPQWLTFKDRRTWFSVWLGYSVLVTLFACAASHNALRRIRGRQRYRALDDAVRIDAAMAQCQWMLQWSAPALAADFAAYLGLPHPLNLAVSAFFNRVFLLAQIWYLILLNKVVVQVASLPTAAAAAAAAPAAAGTAPLSTAAPSSSKSLRVPGVPMILTQRPSETSVLPSLGDVARIPPAAPSPTPTIHPGSAAALLSPFLSLSSAASSTPSSPMRLWAVSAFGLASPRVSRTSLSAGASSPKSAFASPDISPAASPNLSARRSTIGDAVRAAAAASAIVAPPLHGGAGTLLTRRGLQDDVPLEPSRPGGGGGGGGGTLPLPSSLSAAGSVASDDTEQRPWTTPPMYPITRDAGVDTRDRAGREIATVGRMKSAKSVASTHYGTAARTLARDRGSEDEGVAQ
ncbi:hypothetical protein H9P43_003715 [Blastocladiella emersonii ATCC 22665]|nr:hypothetical protein H9P43_003715 [Blastocladiella emersonii ATCC 22665]